MATRIRSYFSLLHLDSAAHLARSAQAIEVKDENFPENEPVAIQHRAYVTGAVFLAVAFLEAFINELYEDATTGELPADFSPSIHLVPPQKRKHRGQSQILVKYQSALEQTELERFDQNSEPYISVSTVIGLRNNLVHYRPQWAVKQDREEPWPIDERYFGRFELTSYWAERPGPLFPHRVLSYGCAKWATESCAQLVENFLARMGKRLTSWHQADISRIREAYAKL